MLYCTMGNLLKMADEGLFDVIVHGCNCWCNMGAGIALQIARKYPQVYEADQQTVRGDRSKLGSYTKALCFTKTPIVKPFIIINAYTQYGCDARKNVDLFEYEAFRTILDKLYEEYGAYRIGFPYIGMGLAGGDSKIIIRDLEQFAIKVKAAGGQVSLVALNKP